MVGLQYWLERTMVIERLTGVTIYVLCLAFSYYILHNARTEKRVVFILNLYLFFLCTMAYLYIPSESADLFRLTKMSNAWAELSFGNFFNNTLVESATPVSHLIMYLCGKTGINGMLPMLSAFIFYSNLFYVLKDLHRKHRISPQSLSLGLLFIMSSDIFLGVISGVRCFTAISILARCFYDEIFNNKAVIKNVLWCILASLTHSFALGLYIIRICLLVFAKKNRLLNICTVILLISAVSIWGGFYLDAMLGKAGSYIYGENYTYTWGYLLNAWGLIIIIISFTHIEMIASNNLLVNRSAIKQMQFLIMCLIVVAVVFSYEYSIFHRTIAFVSILIIPIMILKYEAEEDGNYRVFIKLSSLVLLIISCVRGNLCGYKFFLLW